MDSELSSRHRNPSKSVHVCSSCELENRHLNCDSVILPVAWKGGVRGSFGVALRPRLNVDELNCNSGRPKLI